MMTKVKETAAKTSQKVNEQIGDDSIVFRAARNTWLVGLGTLAISKDEVESAFSHLVEKGEVTEKDFRNTVDEWFDRSREDVTKMEERVERIMDERIEVVLNTMNIPSKSDIDGLSRKISSLSRKVSALDKKLAEEKKAA